jgi:hypothetical protein
LHNSEPVRTARGEGVAAVRRVDFAAYLSKVGDLANRQTLLGVERALRPPRSGRLARSDSATASDIRGCLRGPQVRGARRKVRAARVLSPAGKARVDLQIKMLGAIPATARPAFLKELADHARKYPSSARYLQNLADQGDDVARAVVARIGSGR